MILGNPRFKDLLYTLAVAFFGFILLNLTLFLNWLVTLFIGWVFPADLPKASQWFMPVVQIIFVIIIALISWFIFKSKLKEIYKAIFLTAPLAVVFVMTGIFLYNWPILLCIVSVLIFGTTIFYLHRTKKPWIYYYTVILVSSTLLIMYLLGVEI